MLNKRTEVGRGLVGIGQCPSVVRSLQFEEENKDITLRLR